ncbi:MAG: hypothetical protein GTN67_13340 [Hydrotalea flava]|nr:hypothetical protein [Hydrotalea flava]NIN04377.1 hypothetical protein [Hydrotalea flava]NIO95068.1 hypothetical protein [Hydrotalea flava]
MKSICKKVKKTRTEIMRKLHYRRKYNCTIAFYDFLYTLQNGRCAVCGRDNNYSHKHFDIDHDHYTGHARGLLCTACNFLVGRAERLEPLSDKTAKKVNNYLLGRVQFGHKFEIDFLFGE